MNETLASVARTNWQKLALAAVASILLYQWYYVSPACSRNSKTVWMWMTPKGNKEITPEKPDFVLFQIPSAYINKYKNREYHWGGKVGFLRLTANIDDVSPHCLREEKITYPNERTGPVRRVPANNPEYIDGYDLKQIWIGINAPNIGSRYYTPEKSMKLIDQNKNGFSVYVGEYDTPGESNEYLFLSDPKQQHSRAFYCARSFGMQNRHTLCGVEVMHKGLYIQYKFHSSLLTQWADIEKKVLHLVDGFIVYNQ